MLSLFSLILLFVVNAIIGAVILRASCSLLNLFSRGQFPEPEVQREFLDKQKPPVGSRNVEPDNENSNPYAAPAEYTVRAGQTMTQSAVPVPRFGQAVGIVTIWFISFVIANVIINLMANSALPLDMVLVQAGLGLSILFLGFAIMAGLLTAMLPTSFSKACVVSLVYTIIGIVVMFAIGFVIGFVIAWYGRPY